MSGLSQSQCVWLKCQDASVLRPIKKVLCLSNNVDDILKWAQALTAIEELWVAVDVVLPELLQSRLFQWNNDNHKVHYFDLVLVAPLKIHRPDGDLKEWMSLVCESHGLLLLAVRRQIGWVTKLFGYNNDDTLIHEELLKLALIFDEYDPQSRVLIPKIDDQQLVQQFMKANGDSEIEMTRVVSILKEEGTWGLDQSLLLDEPGRIFVLNSKSCWWPQGKEADFHNFGFAKWQVLRNEWTSLHVGERPPAPIAVPYEQLVAGLASTRRIFELPRPMRLADLIDIYLDIWESQDGY